ncbi:MAG TPA: YdeI/OmpD-associated family protein [Lacunisphaera sp.]|jgi:hypothetical protein|nr:YdeI/OmpD-associated family protein [Lacunisphaera sp.]
MEQIPADFGSALRQSQLAAFFRECAYVHRAGYLRWIAEARLPATRRRKIRQAIRRLQLQRAELRRVAGSRGTP